MNKVFLVLSISILVISCEEDPASQQSSPIFTDACGVVNGDMSTCSDECGTPYGDDNNGDGFCQSDLDALEDLIQCSDLFQNGISPFLVASDGSGNGNGTCDEWEDFIDELNGIYDEGEIWIDELCNGMWADGIYNGPEPFEDENGNGIYDSGESFTDCMCSTCEDDWNWNPNWGNGIWDEGEVFTDAGNGNGVWDEGEGWTEETNGQSWENGRITYLYLSNSNLTCLPESIGSLSALESLFLSNNQLTSLPESIGNLSTLASIYLTNNQLTSLPENICNLLNSDNFWHISLEDNEICDEEYQYECLEEYLIAENWEDQNCDD